MNASDLFYGSAGLFTIHGHLSLQYKWFDWCTLWGVNAYVTPIIIIVKIGFVISTVVLLWVKYSSQYRNVSQAIYLF